MNQLHVFIGWDAREAEAFEVARFSLLRHATIKVHVHALRQDTLRRAGFYWRQKDEPASTEFTYTRFLTPLMTGFTGRALYFDCDFLWLDDVAKLLNEASSGKAVHCVHHDYRPSERTKMDGVKQTSYPRKNWSSLMLFNCEHEDVRRLTAHYVNTASPQALHRFDWASDGNIGALSVGWNWLEGWYDAEDVEPRAIHYTRGGPWFRACRQVQFADRWKAELQMWSASVKEP